MDGHGYGRFSKIRSWRQAAGMGPGWVKTEQLEVAVLKKE